MELNQDDLHAACEKVIAGLNAQLTEQFEISSKYVMALENAARMAEQGILSADGGQAATEIRSLVDAKYRLASAPDDGSCIKCGCVPRGSGGLCATCRDEKTGDEVFDQCPVCEGPMKDWQHDASEVTRLRLELSRVLETLEALGDLPSMQASIRTALAPPPHTNPDRGAP